MSSMRIGVLSLATLFLLSIAFGVGVYWRQVSASQVSTDYFVTSGADVSDGSAAAFSTGDIAKLSAGDDSRIQSDGDWPASGSYDEARYIEFIFSPTVPNTALITSVAVTHEYRRSGTLNGAKLEVWDGNIWHDENLTIPSSSNVDLIASKSLEAYIDTPAKVNGLKIRFLAFRSSGGKTRTSHDLVGVTIVSETPTPTPTLTPMPTPTKNIVGYKWSDLSGDGLWQKGGGSAELGVENWNIALGKVGRPASASAIVPIEIIALSLTDGGGRFSFSVNTSGSYKIFEEKKTNWAVTWPAASQSSSFDVSYKIDVASKQFNFDSFFDVFVDFGIGGNEIASDSHGNSLIFGNHQLAVISNQSAANSGGASTTITWATDKPATSRVIYDAASHPALASGLCPSPLAALNCYGYANSTAEADAGPKVTSHSIAISGLTAGTTYYFRTVSRASPEAVSGESSFTTQSAQSSSSGGGGGGGGGSGGGSSVITPVPEVAAISTSTPTPSENPSGLTGGSEVLSTVSNRLIKAPPLKQQLTPRQVSPSQTPAPTEESSPQEISAPVSSGLAANIGKVFNFSELFSSWRPGIIWRLGIIIFGAVVVLVTLWNRHRKIL